MGKCTITIPTEKKNITIYREFIRFAVVHYITLESVECVLLVCCVLHNGFIIEAIKIKYL